MVVRCAYCKKMFNKKPAEVGRTTTNFCSTSHANLYKIKEQQVHCQNCGISFMKKSSAIRKSPAHFCSRSCSATWHNTHKSHGCRRSKLEVWLEQQLTNQYPQLNFQFNSRDVIHGELDIYIPSLKLAFELNGIFHYEPIFGNDKLNRTQLYDKLKFRQCHELGIGLCVIDTTEMDYFKEHKANKYLDIITQIIQENQTS